MVPETARAGRVELYRVTELDTPRYAEVSLGRILPDPDDEWLGLHSISRSGGVTFVDRLRRRRRCGRAPVAGACGSPRPLG